MLSTCVQLCADAGNTRQARLAIYDKNRCSPKTASLPVLSAETKIDVRYVCFIFAKYPGQTITSSITKKYAKRTLRSNKDNSRWNTSMVTVELKSVGGQIDTRKRRHVGRLLFNYTQQFNKAIQKLLLIRMQCIFCSHSQSYPNASLTKSARNQITGH